MRPENSGSGSPWWSDAPASPLLPLREDARADVVVVGGGIAGLSVAHALVERGRSVVVLDDGPIGGGETGRTTAHLVTALDRRYFAIERMHGAEAARLAAQSHGAAIDRIESIAEREGIACEFLRVHGFLFVPPDRRAIAKEWVEREHDAATRAGVPCTVLSNTPHLAVECGPCLGFTRQAQFHPMKYLHGLARAITDRGGRIFTGSHAHTITGGADARVRTSDGFTVRAEAVVVATNTPVNDVLTMHTKQVASRTYVLGLRIPRAFLPPVLLWDGFWENHNEPYHYVRLMHDGAADRDLLLVGGEDHATGRESDHVARFARLEQWARTMFPAVGEVAFRWSGQVMEPHDECAFIGRNPGDHGNVFIVTGDSGNGMTHATIAAIVLPDLIEGSEHPWTDLYSPGRLPTGAAGTALTETAHMIAEYRDWVTPHVKPGADGPALGEGVVVRIGGKLRALYRGLDGRLVERSAVCPHLFGVVRWNACEKSWDCPCHGSRFDCEGRAISGPANSDLAEVTPSEPVGDAAPACNGIVHPGASVACSLPDCGATPRAVDRGDDFSPRSPSLYNPSAQQSRPPGPVARG